MQCCGGNEVNTAGREVMWRRVRPTLAHTYSYHTHVLWRSLRESDARTHRTPKALTCEIKEALFPLFATALGVRARLRAAFAGVAGARHEFYPMPD